MTTKELFDKYIPRLILMMKDPTPAILLCKPWSGDSKIMDITRNLPDEKMSDLWNIVKKAKYREDPKSLIKEFNEEAKKLAGSQCTGIKNM